MKSHTNSLIKFAPMIFVLLWATGFVGARYGTIDAEPLTFLLVRFILTIALLLLFFMIWLKPKNIAWSEVWHSMIIGVFLHGGYLGGVFYAVSKGMPAGISSFVVAFQPFFTALIAFLWLGERVSILKLVFFVSALCGVFLVLFPQFELTNAIPGVTAGTLLAAAISPISFSIGAVYQKKYVQSLNLWVGAAAQFIGAAIVVGLISFATESQHIIWSLPTVLSLFWLVLVLSIGAIGLLMYLIKNGDAASVASLFFLVPVVSLLMAWILFDETLDGVQILGSLLVVISVGISQRFT